MKHKIREHILRGSATVAVDTNTAYRGLGQLLAVANFVNRFNERKPNNSIKLVIPVAAFMEILHHTWHDMLANHREVRSIEFRIKTEMEALESKGVMIVPFEQEHAKHVAQVLAGRYGDDASWQRAKQSAVQERLSLPDDFFDSKKKQKITCGATLDWLIAGQAEAEKWILATNDDGPEFALVSLKIGWHELKEVLEELLKSTS